MKTKLLNQCQVGDVLRIRGGAWLVQHDSKFGRVLLRCAAGMVLSTAGFVCAAASAPAAGVVITRGIFGVRTVAIGRGSSRASDVIDRTGEGLLPAMGSYHGNGVPTNTTGLFIDATGQEFFSLTMGVDFARISLGALAVDVSHGGFFQRKGLVDVSASTFGITCASGLANRHGESTCTRSVKRAANYLRCLGRTVFQSIVVDGRKLLVSEVTP